MHSTGESGPVIAVVLVQALVPAGWTFWLSWGKGHIWHPVGKGQGCCETARSSQRRQQQCSYRPWAPVCLIGGRSLEISLLSSGFPITSILWADGALGRESSSHGRRSPCNTRAARLEEKAAAVQNCRASADRAPSSLREPPRGGGGGLLAYLAVLVRACSEGKGFK